MSNLHYSPYKFVRMADILELLWPFCPFSLTLVVLVYILIPPFALNNIMNLNNFTTKSQEAIQQASQIAFENGQQAIKPGHILKAIFDVDENVLPFLLKKLNIQPDLIESGLD